MSIGIGANLAGGLLVMPACVNCDAGTSPGTPAKDNSYGGLAASQDGGGGGCGGGGGGGGGSCDDPSTCPCVSPDVCPPLPPGSGSSNWQDVVPIIGSDPVKGVEVYCAETGVTMLSPCGYVRFYSDTTINAAHYSGYAGCGTWCARNLPTVYAGSVVGSIPGNPISIPASASGPC